VNGFVKKPSMPASKHSVRSSSLGFAVNAITGTRALLVDRSIIRISFVAATVEHRHAAIHQDQIWPRRRKRCFHAMTAVRYPCRGDAELVQIGHGDECVHVIVLNHQHAKCSEDSWAQL
jgi:hypothetical protein